MNNCQSCGAGDQRDIFCSICGEKLASGRQDDASFSTRALPSFRDFKKFRQEKETERRQTFTFRKSKKPTRVKINVGVMRLTIGTLKYQRGTLLPIEVFPSNTETDVLKVATDKHHKNNKMLPTEEYILLYKDGSRASSIPGTTNVFTVRGYKDFLGKPFQNMQLYICPKTEFESNVSNSSDSDDLPDPKLNNKNEVGDDSWEELGTPEILKRKRPATKSRNRAPERETQNIDSVNPAPKPENRVLDAETRVIKQENDRMEQPSTYSEYITIISDGSDQEEDLNPPSPSEAKNTQTVDMACSSQPPRSTVEILQELSLQIQSNDISRFNINRRNVWDGACRGFRRSTFAPNNILLVKFTDDTGLSEEAVDQGGPRREFLRLLMDALQNSTLFEGPTTSRILTLNSHAIQRDKYYLAGVMVAIDLVHGGPPPMFFSKLLFDMLVFGPENVHPTIEDIPESEFKQSLNSILQADTLKNLRSSMEANSSTLTLAGCFHHVRSIEDKVPLIRDMIKWYCLERTRTAFDRFKSGLQTLGVLATIQSYPESFRDCLMFTNIKLTAISMEDIFRPCVSPTGSNRRTVEDRLVGYWRDFLQDAEEGATVVTLEHLLIFATGTNRVPPLGLSPSPVLSFLHEEEGGGKFPIANTCGNELKIPIHPSFEMFKENMEFGILNAPNFGRA